jgi:tight adherence protein C
METAQLSSATIGFRYASAAMIGAGLFGVTYILASAESREGGRFGLRGLKRQQELSRNEQWATIEPFVRWLGVRLSPILTTEQRTSIDKMLGLAGDWMGATADEFVALSLLSGFAGFLLAYAVHVVAKVDLSLIGILGVTLGVTIPYQRVSDSGIERMRLVSRGLPYVVDLMALSMSAGLDFPGAIRQVVEKSSNPEDPMVEEFTLILQTLNLGRTRKEAMLEFARRCPIEAVIEFTNSLVQAEERGNPVAEVLTIQASISRNKRSVRAEELAAQAAVKLVAPLMLVFVVVLILILGPNLLGVMGAL